eukprot:Em0046g19a
MESSVKGKVISVVKTKWRVEWTIGKATIVLDHGKGVLEPKDNSYKQRTLSCRFPVIEGIYLVGSCAQSFTSGGSGGIVFSRILVVAQPQGETADMGETSEAIAAMQELFRNLLDERKKREEEEARRREQERLEREEEREKTRGTVGERTSGAHSGKGTLPHHVRALMSAYNIPKDRWIFKLAPQLSGKAQQAYAALTTEDALEYDGVESSDPEAVMTSPRRRTVSVSGKITKNVVESHRDVSIRLGDLTNKWLKGLTTVEQVKEAIVLEQLLYTLGPSVRVWVKERKPKTALEAGQLADDYSEARKQTAKESRPGVDLASPASSEKPTRHDQEQPDKEEGDKRSAKERHYSRSGYRNKDHHSHVTCYNCGRQGHFASRCPEKAMYCGDSLRHKAALQKAGVVEGQMVEDIVLDTGCSKTLIHHALMYPNLCDFLRTDSKDSRNFGGCEALMMVTRAGAKKREAERRNPTAEGGRIRMEGGPRVKLTRSQKRMQRRQHQRDIPVGALDMSAVELQKLQETDPSLAQVRSMCGTRKPQESESHYLNSEGLLFRRWIQRRGKPESAVEQLVLPTQCLPMKAIDAEHIAEELVKIFARVGIPEEILTDQGSNFTSQLLAEIYQLLHVHPIRTTPYHPQTDGLVERFNKTLKEMLRKVAADDGANWDKWVPYLLFAYREVPQDSTGFSPFELLYGRAVRGPLDILKESWKEPNKCGDNVVSYVLAMQDKLATMAEMVKGNLERAQQSRNYASSVNYVVDMHDTRKRERTFHINMLKKWNTPTYGNYWADVDDEESSEDDIPEWRGSEKGEPTVGDQLSAVQKSQLNKVLETFSDVMSSIPGHTTEMEHQVTTTGTRPVRLPPYRLPHAYRDLVEKEIKEMLVAGVIEPSSSEWASPIVLGAPATFQRLMDKVLQGLEDYAAAYIDDLVIHSTTWEEHLTQIQTVFQRLRLAGLTAKPQKCQLGMSRCVYLGHVVGSGLVQPERSKMQGVESFPTPTTKKQTSQRMRHRIRWCGQTDARAHFRSSRAYCVENLSLRSPDFTKEFVLQTDASDVGVGAVLSQLDEEGADHPVAYYSRKLLAREQKYATIEKECLAIKLATQAFRVYLLGRPFIIQTDHRALEWLDRLRENNAKLSRWSIALQPFKFQVCHRPGKDNGNADCLSRLPTE